MLKSFARVTRLIQINIILLKYSLDELVFSWNVFRPIRFLRYCNPWYRRNINLPRGERLRRALEALGPIFIKFGQSLSTRKDFIPEDIANELAKLQDHVPPFPGEIAQAIIENSLGKPIEKVYLEFNLTPLASASVAQVHTGKLYSGEDVVIKVIRPDVKKRIIKDIDLLFFLARLAESYWVASRRLRPIEVVKEFERHLIDELDLMHEAANASQLKRNFLDSTLLYVPKIYWDFTRSDILTMERISGISISDINSLKLNRINLKRLAERGIEIFFTQVFRDCFFHADMHPGNIFVAIHPQENPQLMSVDFGIMGTLSALDQRYLAENLLAFFRKDYQYVAKLHIESGWVPPETRMDEFEAAIRTVSEPVFERPLKEISFGQLLLHLFQTARRFNMEIQPQLLLLQKTLFNIEGLGRQLYPEIDLWATAKPHIEHWVKQQMGMPALVKKVRKYIPYWLEKLPEIPDLLYQTLMERSENQKKSAIQAVKKEVSIKTVSRKMNYIISTLGILFLAMSLLNYFSQKTLKFFLTPHGFSWGIGGIGVLLLLLSMVPFSREEV